MISTLFVSNEHRGNDASGLCIAQADGSLAILKQDIQAWTFVTGKEYETFMEKNLKPDTWAVIVHTRGASVGNPRDNNNNHPMYKGLSAIIHNGSINNHAHIFDQLKMERSAETDSDVIRAITDKFGLTQKAVEEMNRLSGSMASAALHPKYPKSMLLMRSGSPMCLASTEKFFAFASEKDSLHKALRPFVKRFGMEFQIQKPDAAFSYMADDTAWFIDANGLKWHAKLKTLTGQYQEPWRQTYEKYSERQQKFDRTADSKADYSKREEGWCYKCKKAWLIPNGSDPRTKHCNKAHGGCGEVLVPMPIINRKVN